MPGAIFFALENLRRTQTNNERIRKRKFRDLSNPMDTNETCFISLYRLNKRAFQMILEDLAPLLPTSSIPPIIQLAAVLRFLAVGSYQAVIANDINLCLGRSTFCKILWNVMKLLEEKLCATWIKIPLGYEAESGAKSYFYQKFGIPGVIGCVDGTLIRIQKPPSDHAQYFSRKGYYSLNAMMICDHEMHIIAVDACRPGSCHDSFVWNMSDAKRYYSEKCEDARNFWVLGDSGYPLKPYLMTPYKSPSYGSAQHTFNQKHASARNIVERTIGVLKSRFRCLLNALPYSPPKVVTIVNVCCALHNICSHYGVPLPEEILTDPTVNDLEMEEDEINIAASTIRDNIARSLHSNNIA